MAWAASRRVRCPTLAGRCKYLAQECADPIGIESVRTRIFLNLVEGRVRIAGNFEFLVEIGVVDAHRLAEQADVVDDRKWIVRLRAADLPVARVIKRGENIDARLFRGI